MFVNIDMFLVKTNGSRVDSVGTTGLTIDTDYNKYKHTVQTGKIFATPIGISSKYENDTILSVGDEVVFHHFVCQSDNRSDFGENVYRADYFHLYGKINNGKLMALEDIVFVEPIIEDKSNLFCGGLQIKSSLDNVSQQGKVFAASKKAQSLGVKSGDRVFFTKDADYSMKILDTGLYRMRIRNIVAVIRNGRLVCLKDKILIKQIEQEQKEGVLFSVSENKSLLGKIVKTGDSVVGVKEGEIASYYNGVGGSFLYNNELYSFVETRHINYIIDGN